MSSTLNSVTQALKVLDALKEHREMGITDISQLLSCAVSTAHRIATTLAVAGYAEQSLESKKYGLGPAMRKTTAEMDLALCVKIAAPFMCQLRDATEETVQLAVLEETQIRFLAAFESEKIMRVTSRVGAQMPAHTTAAGKLLLAHVDPAEVDKLYAQGLPEPRTPNSISSVARFKELLLEANSKKYTISLGETEPEVTAIAAAIGRPQQKPICALTISGPSGRFSPDKFESHAGRGPSPLAMLMDVAEQISNALLGTSESF